MDANIRRNIEALCELVVIMGARVDYRIDTYTCGSKNHACAALQSVVNRAMQEIPEFAALITLEELNAEFQETDGLNLFRIFRKKLGLNLDIRGIEGGRNYLKVYQGTPAEVSTAAEYLRSKGFEVNY